MADGSFPGLVSKDRNVNALANPIYVNLTDGTTGVAIDGSGYLTVNINGTVTVDATNLDIRDLLHASDSVEFWANTAKDGTGTAYVPLVDADGKLIISNAGGTEYVEDAVAAANATAASLLVERDDVLSAITPVAGDWSKLYCSAEGALWVQDFNSDAILAKATDIETNTDFGAVVGGGVEATALRVTIASDSTGLVSVDDGGGTLTVDNAVLSVVGGGTEATAQRVTIANDSTGTLTVDASDLDIRDLTHVSDSVSIGDGTDTMAVNTDGSINVNIVSAAIGGEIHDYDTAAAVASDATDNHDYTVATALLLKSVIVAGGGNIKFEIQSGPTASLVTIAVGFLTGRQGDTKQVFFDPPVEVPTTGTGIVRIIRTNRQGAATDVYSTIIGIDA